MTPRTRVAKVPSAEPRTESRKKRAWPRRVGRTLLVVAVVLVVARFALVLALPALIDRWAKPRGLACGYEKLNLALLRGRVELWHLTLAERAEGDAARATPAEPRAEPIVHLEYATLDVDMAALCKFTFALDRVEVDGLDVKLEREADGQLNLVRLFGLAATSSPDGSSSTPVPTPTAAPSDEPPAPIELSPPIAIAALRVQNVRVRYVDAHVTPAIDARLDVDLSLSDLGSDVRPARLELAVFSPDDLGSLFAEARISGDALARHGDFEAEIVVRRPQVWSGQLAELGIAPSARQISFRMRAEADVAVQGERKDEIRARLALHDVRLSADLEEALALDSVTCTVDSLSARSAHVADILVSGARVAAGRLSNRALRVAGLDFLSDEQPAKTAAQDAPIAVSLPSGYVWQFDRIALEKGSVRFADSGVEPATELKLELDRFAIDRFDTQATDAAKPITVHMLLHAPGTAATTKLDGTFALFSRHKMLDLDLGADHITLQAIAPYLRDAGWESDLTSGTLAFKIVGQADEDAQGVTRGEVRLEGFHLTDGDEVIGIDRIALADLVVDPSRSLVRIGRVEISGTRCGYERDANLVTHFLGMRSVLAPQEPAPVFGPTPAPKPLAPSKPSTGSTAVNPAAPDRASRFEIGSLVWRDAALRFSDAAIEPKLALDLADMELDVRDLALGGKSSDPVAAPATVRMKLAAAGIVEELALDATIASRPGPLDLSFDVRVRGSGIRAGELSPYLLAQGIDSKLDGAKLALDLKASLKSDGAGIAADLALEHVALENAGERSVALEGLRVRDVHFQPDAIRVGELDVQRPSAIVSRDAQGAMILGGLRFIPAPPRAPDAKPPPSLFAPLLRPLLEQLKLFFAQKNILIGRARLSGADLAWKDASVSPPVDVHALLGAKLDGLAMGEAAPPGSFGVELSVPGALEKMELSGSLSIAPNDGRASMSFAASGLDAGPLVAYLPPGLGAELHGGSLRFKLDAAAKAVPEGGMSAELVLGDLVYDTGGAAEPTKLGAFTVKVPRVDMEQHIVTIDELSLRGVELGARRDAEGNLHAFGLIISAHPAEQPISSANAAHAESAPAVPVLEVAPPAGLVPYQTVTLPTIQLSKLDLGLERFTFVDATKGEGAVPIVGSLRVTNAGPSVLLGPEPDSLPPVHVDVHAAIEPLVKSIDVAFDVRPFADEPTLRLTLAAHGVRGAGLTEIAPALAERIDGSGLTEGELTAELELSLGMDRHTPTGFDFGRGFGANLTLANVAFRDRPGGAILAGLDALSITADRIMLSTSNVHITTFDVITPRGAFSRQADGLHALGLVVKPAPGVAQSEAAPAQAEPEAPASKDSAKPTEAAATPPAGSAEQPSSASPQPTYEVRIDELDVSGIDLVLRDDSTTPPVVLPLVDLEIDVDRFTTRSFSEPIPVHFTAYLAAGAIDLPRRANEGGLGGVVDNLPVVSTVSDAVLDPGAHGVPTESRLAFEELTGKGAIAFHPSLGGSVTTDMRALELLNFVGLARDAGITLNDGVLDSRVSLKVDPVKGADFKARLRFSNLSVSEPIGGPIQRYLLLPAPLDQVLFVLRDKNGDQVVPLNFSVEAENLSKSQITKAAILAFSRVTAKAIANAPLRIVSWIGSWFGIGTGESEKLANAARSVRLDPGDTVLSSAALREIEPVIELLKSDSDTMIVVHQELGEGDFARAEVLANPSPEDAREIALRLQQERAELVRQSDELERQARALAAVGRAREAEAAGIRMRAVVLRTGEIEASLDRTLDLLRPGADRYRGRRTHAACRVIGEQRIVNLRELLAQRGVSDLDARIEVRALRPEPTAGAGGGRLTLKPRLRSAP